jgi:hypothetical protein
MERKDQLHLFLDLARRAPDLPQQAIAAIRKNIADLLLQVIEDSKPEEVNEEASDEPLR